MTAFDNAWTLLKNRGFEVMPQQREMDPMTRHLLNQQAEGIEAEGIDLPDVSSSAPPADIGRAGSLTPEPHRELDFNPFTYHENNRLAEELYLDEKRNPYGHGGLKEYSESLEQTPLGQALTQARSQPPQPLQFEKAWATLKALPEQQVLGPDDQPLKTLHPAIQGMMERRGTLQPEGQEIQNIGHIKSWHPLHDPRTPEEIENREPANYNETVYPEIGVPGKELREGERFHDGKERLTRERNEAIPTEGALQGGYRTSMRPQTDLTISEGYPYEIPERGIYTNEEGYPEYATDRHPYTARFASMYGEPETMDEKFKYGYGRFIGR
tara:strand:+ start:10681 stop:11658 length:978 start_codon:yes stop_codon:yes gene_type:complete